MCKYMQEKHRILQAFRINRMTAKAEVMEMRTNTFVLSIKNFSYK